MTDTIATNTTVEEVEGTYETEEELQEKIEDEIIDDALFPFKWIPCKIIYNSEVKSFFTKNNVRFIDSLYEKNMEKFH